MSKRSKRQATLKRFSHENSFAPSDYTPSHLFRIHTQFRNAIELRQTHSALSEDELSLLADGKDVITRLIAAAPAKSLGDLYEKMLIWRTECLMRSQNGYLQFDDILPVSAYLDLKSILQIKSNALAADDEELAARLSNF